MLGGPESCPTPTAPGGPELASSHIPDRTSPSCLPATSFTPEARLQGKSQSSITPLGAPAVCQQEVQDLKEQLEALRCQVGGSLQSSIQKCYHFFFDSSRVDVNTLLPGEDLWRNILHGSA